MKIAGFQKHSHLDYPGHSAAVIFTQGCNWRCPFCHNPCLVLPEQFTNCFEEEKILAHLSRRKGLLDAVVVTGGEPTIHHDLPNFLQKLRDMEFLIKLDTNGSRPEVLREILRLRLIDYIAMDLKAPLHNYAEAVGTKIDPQCIRTSLWLIKNSGVEHEIRTTAIPGLHTIHELREMSNLVLGAQKYVIQEFLSDRALRREFVGRVAFTRKTLQDQAKYFKNKVTQFSVRTTEEALAQPELIQDLESVSALH